MRGHLDERRPRHEVPAPRRPLLARGVAEVEGRPGAERDARRDVAPRGRGAVALPRHAAPEARAAALLRRGHAARHEGVPEHAPRRRALRRRQEVLVGREDVVHGVLDAVLRPRPEVRADLREAPRREQQRLQDRLRRDGPAQGVAVVQQRALLAGRERPRRARAAGLERVPHERRLLRGRQRREGVVVHEARELRGDPGVVGARGLARADDAERRVRPEHALGRERRVLVHLPQRGVGRGRHQPRAVGELDLAVAQEAAERRPEHARRQTVRAVEHGEPAVERGLDERRPAPLRVAPRVRDAPHGQVPRAHVLVAEDRAAAVAERRREVADDERLPDPSLPDDAEVDADDVVLDHGAQDPALRPAQDRRRARKTLRARARDGDGADLVAVRGAERQEPPRRARVRVVGVGLDAREEVGRRRDAQGRRRRAVRARGVAAVDADVVELEPGERRRLRVARGVLGRDGDARVGVAGDPEELGPRGEDRGARRGFRDGHAVGVERRVVVVRVVAAAADGHAVGVERLVALAGGAVVEAAAVGVVAHADAPPVRVVLEVRVAVRVRVAAEPPRERGARQVRRRLRRGRAVRARRGELGRLGARRLRLRGRARNPLAGGRGDLAREPGGRPKGRGPARVLGLDDVEAGVVEPGVELRAAVRVEL